MAIVRFTVTGLTDQIAEVERIAGEPSPSTRAKLDLTLDAAFAFSIHRPPGHRQHDCICHEIF